jgi:ribonuclease BN (tRNA processing enzyme)
MKTMMILYTHYHYDHTIGVTMAPVTYFKDVKMVVYGPEEHSVGPSKMLEDLLKPPYFPVDFKEVSSHILCKGIDFPNSRMFLIHPRGGAKYFTMDQIENIEKDGKMVSFDRGMKYNLDECLVIKMYKSNHPERTISYRFEEKPTGKVFVFLTDHENQDGMPWRLKHHIKEADLLVMDAQYDRKKYDDGMAGFGHGTPDYCVRIAENAKVKLLGFTHHDPSSTDERIEAILSEGKQACSAPDEAQATELFSCRDYQSITL